MSQILHPAADRPLAYSYVRFSTPEQAKGNSYRRQVEAAEAYAAKMGLELSRESFTDLGISAWRGTNVVTGKLGMFLAAANAGDVPRGSFLLVESLDRVSRSNAWEALTVLQSIVAAGITVVTLSDEKTYNFETMSRDPMALMMSVLIFSRGNEESELKSARVRDAWRKKKQLARDEGRPMTKITPGWLRLTDDGQSYALIEERVEVVREIIRQAVAGVGLAKIAAGLNASGIEPWGVGKKRAALWHKSYIAKIITSPALIGTFSPRVSHKEDGRRVFEALDPILNYYPAVISAEELEALAVRGDGLRRPPMRAITGHVSNVLAGLAKCPRCGSTMTRVNKGRKGGPAYLVCVLAKGGAGCEYHAVRLPSVEAALRIHAERICATAPDRDEALDEEWLTLEHDIDIASYSISNLIEEIERGNPSSAIRTQLAHMEEERATLTARQRGLVAAIQRSSGKTLARLLDGLEAALLDEVSTATQINAALRPLLRSVRVNYLTGMLEFHWLHSDRETEVMFAWPSANAGE